MGSLDKIKLVLNHEDKKKKWLARSIISLLAIFTLAFAGAFTIHKIDQAISNVEAVEITLDDEVKQDYSNQIMDFIKYDSFDLLTWKNVKEKRGKHYVEIFDGYTTSTFVFTDGQLSHYGTKIQGDLTPIQDL